MPVVPFSRQPNALPEALQPDEAHLMMAAATMHALGRLPSPEPKIDLLKRSERKMEADQEINPYRHQEGQRPKREEENI